MAYATPADLLARKSSLTIGDLVSEDGNAVAAGALPANAKVLAALDDASGAIEAALMQGGRYTANDLTGLTGTSEAYLVRMTCEIAMAFLFALKPTYSSDEYKNALAIQDVYLDRLRRGENVLNVQRNIDAGTPDVAMPTAVDISHLQLIRDRSRRYYPRRVDQTGEG